MSVAGMSELVESVAANQRAAARRRQKVASSGLWYVAADGDRGHHGLPVLLDAVDVAQGPARPDHLGAAAVPPGQPDAGELREGAGQPADPALLLQQRGRRGRGRAAQRAGRRAGGLPAGQDALPGSRRDLLPAAGDADRARPADVHPELRAGGQRLPLLRHAGRADLPEPGQRLQHLPVTAGVPGRPAGTSSTRPASTGPGSSGSGARS